MTGLPDVDVLFSHFLLESGSLAAARVRFQSLITDLVAIRHPDANEVAGPGGTDWGIDTYVGSLAGDVFVWQSKFFPKWDNKDPQNQVRGSFNQLMAKAKTEGISVKSWTLCVPCILDPSQQLWFDRWSAKQKRQHCIEVDMWNGVILRRSLGQLDATHLVKRYFSDKFSEPLVEDLQTLDDPSVYDEALFVRQLEEAGYTSNDSARGCFFAAEVVARDVIGRGDPESIMALKEIDAEVHSAWESDFNSQLPQADSCGRMQNLIRTVMDDVTKLPNPAGLGLRAAHRRGFMHRVVEDRRAGWVQHWESIAHANVPAHSCRSEVASEDAS